jgi:hypothetical protein
VGVERGQPGHVGGRGESRLLESWEPGFLSLGGRVRRAARREAWRMIVVGAARTIAFVRAGAMEHRLSEVLPGIRFALATAPGALAVSSRASRTTLGLAERAAPLAGWGRPGGRARGGRR